ncbi:MAG TPA: UdgX family uracil-DNA binding protein [Pyrinomonadaceae bacterium]|nr:UdgX family uracil-DNA binding protein [Pyrinomonadaceae bacterium]
MQAVPDRSALDYFPEDINYGALKAAAAGCMGCDLYKDATQTVFGEGRIRESQVVFVGEQPGDEEDLNGHPFVGPAGRLFDKALVEAGIDREKAYVTNVVKHFKWKPRGKRRIHEKPRAAEIRACEPWLAAELEVVRPRILVCLGATAAQALLGKDFRVTQMRGQWLQSGHAERTLATVHPSSILRAPDAETRAEQYAEFVDDLKMVAGVIG